MKKSLGFAMLLLVSIGTSFARSTEKLTEEQSKLLSDSGWYKIKDYSAKVEAFEDLTGKISVWPIKYLEVMLDEYDFLVKEKNNYTTALELANEGIDFQEAELSAHESGSKILSQQNIDKLKEGIVFYKERIKVIKKALKDTEKIVKSIGKTRVKKAFKNAEDILNAIWRPGHEKIRMTIGTRGTVLKRGRLQKVKDFENSDYEKKVIIISTWVQTIESHTISLVKGIGYSPLYGLTVEDIKLLEAMSNYLGDKGRKQYKTKQAIQNAKDKLEKIWGLKKFIFGDILGEMNLLELKNLSSGNGN